MGKRVVNSQYYLKGVALDLSRQEVFDHIIDSVSNDKTEFVGMYFKMISETGSSIRILKFKGLQ